MTRRPGISVWTRTFRTACLVLIAACLVTTTHARAGIGNPLKKVKEKIAEKVKPAEQEAEPETISNETIVFDDVTLELTNARLDRIVAAFKAAKAAGTGRPAAVERLNKAMEERGQLYDKHGEAIQELERKRGDIEVCYHDGYNEAQDRKTQEYSQKALTDPAIREKFMRVAQEQNAAAAGGDSAAIAKINAVLYSEMLPSSEDSAAVRKKCGPKPPITPAETRIAALDKVIAAQTEEIRTIDMNIAKAQAKELQMKEDQFAAAMERIQVYMAWKNYKSGSKPQSPRGFTPEELDALEKHLEELRGSLG
jgi:uncharacterized coiled-coil protein SlyX